LYSPGPSPGQAPLTGGKEITLLKTPKHNKPLLGFKEGPGVDVII